MPEYQTHAPQGYCGDWRRGAPLGRPTIGDTRTAAEIESAFIENAQRLSDALRLKEKRPGDIFKASAWEAAAAHYREERDALKAAFKAAKERESASPKVTLQRVRLDSGGYDSQGAYWGQGDPLYWAATDCGSYDSTFRAANREEAKATVRGVYPNARFYR